LDVLAALPALADFGAFVVFGALPAGLALRAPDLAAAASGVAASAAAISAVASSAVPAVALAREARVLVPVGFLEDLEGWLGLGGDRTHGEWGGKGGRQEEGQRRRWQSDRAGPGR